MSKLTVFMWAGLYAGTNAAGLFLMKTVLNDLRSENAWALLLDVMRQPVFVAGFGLYASGFVIFLWVLSSGLLSVTLPLFIGAGGVGVIVVSFALLHEPATWRTVFGIISIGLGIALLQEQL